jgi:hypothetical protein
MSIRRRLTEDRKLVSWYDEFWACVSKETIQAYMKSLDVQALGDLSQYPLQPTVFTASPLPTSLESFAHGTHPNPWVVFSNCVSEATGIQMRRSNGVIIDDDREIFPSEVVIDISDQIKTVTDRGTDAVFFTPPEEFLDFVKGAARNAAKALAVSVGAKSKSPSTDHSHSITDTPQSSE